MSVVQPRIRSASFRQFGWAAFNALQLLFTVAWTAAWICAALLVLALTGGRRHWPLRMAARCWAPGLLRGSGARLQVEGLENVDWSRPHVFVANHQSIIDICALFRALPVPLHFVLKQELANVPFVGWYARAMGMVFIERDRARSSRGRLQQAASQVSEGRNLCAFPEGTRSRDGSVRAFKGGAFKVAIEAGVGVVPVAIEGSGSVLPAAGFRVRPGRIVLRIGKPLATRGLTPADRLALAGSAHKAVQDLLARREAGR